MEINSSALIAFRTRYETVFNKAFNLAQPQAEKVCFVFNSGRVEQVLHRWMQGIGMPREFTDERVGTNMTTAGQAVINKMWEKTIDIPKNALERDQYGIYEPHLSRLGQVAKLHRDYLAFAGLGDLLAGTSVTGIVTSSYDGVPFYGSHTIGTQTFNNKVTGSLSSLNLIKAIQEIRNRKDSQGMPLMAASAKPLLIVPPALEYTARQLATLAWFPMATPGTALTQPGAAGENILQGQLDYVVSPFIQSATEWHLTIADELYRPLLLQIEKDIEFLAPPQFFNNWWSDKDIYRVGTRALYNVAPGLPEFAYGSTGTGL
jgi:phage major head subunit gpT-like protein